MFVTVLQRDLQELLRDPRILSQARDLLDRFEISPHGYHTRDRPRRRRSVRRVLSQNSCFCPLYHTWKITSPNICSLKAYLEYAGKPTPLRQCLMITPPIVPLIDGDGHICRTIGEIKLTVDRTASGELVHDTQICGVSIHNYR